MATPFLYDSCVDMSWNKVLLSCQTYPIDALYRDEELGETPLYVACQSRPPVRIIRALLEAYPKAATLLSNNDDLPIHIACRFNSSIEVLRELVKYIPNKPSDALIWGHTVLSTLWDGRDKLESSRNRPNYSTIFWQKVQLIVETVASRQSSAGIFPLHTAVALASMGSPFQVVDFALEIFPSHVNLRNDEGRLPLHVAVGPTVHSVILRVRYKPRQNQVIGKLLKLYPQAASEIDTNEPLGWLPIHTALSNSHQWFSGVNELLDRNRDVLLTRDPTTGMYPFQMAAASIANSTNDLATIYHMLRSEPGALKAPIVAGGEKVSISGMPEDIPCPGPPSSNQTRTSIRGFSRLDSLSTISDSASMSRRMLYSVSKRVLDISDRSISSRLDDDEFQVLGADSNEGNIPLGKLDGTVIEDQNACAADVKAPSILSLCQKFNSLRALAHSLENDGVHGAVGVNA